MQRDKNGNPICSGDFVKFTPPAKHHHREVIGCALDFHHASGNILVDVPRTPVGRGERYFMAPADLQVVLQWNQPEAAAAQASPSATAAGDRERHGREPLGRKQKK